MQSAMQNLGKQMFYGVTNDGKGFPGLKAALPAAGTTLAGDALTIDATGSTSSTASSVYFVKFGVQDLTFVGGQSRAFDLGDFREQMIYDSSGAGYDAYVAALTAWIGMQIGHENVARRIYNLTAEATKGWTDALNARVMATFPVGHRPDAIFCSRRSLAQLQASRTVTLKGSGSTRPNQPNIAPVPTEYEGIPIIATDSILNTDAIGS